MEEGIVETQEIAEALEEAPLDSVGVEEVIQQLHKGSEAIKELNLLKPTLGLLLAKLPKKQLRIRLEDLAMMGEKYGVQAKSDGAGGIILRSVNL
jgi:hypothetical protein